jgi:uncharacterized protein (DUF58 family)
VCTQLYLCNCGLCLSRQSAALPSGSPLYIFLSYVVAGLLIVSAVSFLSILTFEVFRALRFSRYHEKAKVV